MCYSAKVVADYRAYVRLFGAMAETGLNPAGRVRGPLQLSMARSLHPVSASKHQLTRISVTKDEDLNKPNTMTNDNAPTTQALALAAELRFHTDASRKAPPGARWQISIALRAPKARRRARDALIDRGAHESRRFAAANEDVTATAVAQLDKGLGAACQVRRLGCMGILHFDTAPHRRLRRADAGNGALTQPRDALDQAAMGE